MTSTLDTVRHYLLPRSALAGIGAVAMAFLIGALLIWAMGRDPLLAYWSLVDASFGSANGLAETALRTVPLALCGVGIALSFRAGVFNTGAEGQLFIGGTAAAVAGLALSGQPQVLVLCGMALAAGVAGAFWSGVAGVLKRQFRADELITTIMLNYIAIYLVSYLLHGPLQDPGSPLAQTARLGTEARLPLLLAGSRLNAGILIALAVVLIAQIYLWATVGGFKLRATGVNPRAALNAGINAGRVTWFAFLTSGALAGLAGFVEVAGVQRRMIENLSPGYGYTAIIVALLGQTNPIGVLLSAILFAALQIGSRSMETAAGVPSALSTVIQALVVLLLLAQNTLPRIPLGKRQEAGS